MGLILALKEVEELQGFPKVKHSKSQNGFLTMDSLQFSNRMRRNQDIVIRRFWSIVKLEVEASQLVEPKISKWVFSHVFPLSHGTHKN